MFINFDEAKKRFTITTANTEYIFDVFADRYLHHRYYGKKNPTELYGNNIIQGFSTFDAEVGPQFSLSDKFSEFSFFDSGDYRCSSIKLRGKNGDCCTYFTYSGYEIFSGRKDIPNMPCARADQETETLAVYLDDELNNCRLTLYYTVFPKTDIISRYFTLENNGDGTVKLEKAMSICLDLEGHDYDMISLYGRHYHERRVQRHPLFYGNQSVMSRRGMSSHMLNPFIALAESGADEENGSVYGFNFVYSGNFLDEVEVDFIGNTRVGIGLGEENFGYTLESGECFASPEAVMVYSANGLGNMSRKFHKFVINNIVPKDQFEQRPVVINPWEACYFDIDEKIMLNFADEAVKSGVDMLVMDDGWFGGRIDDKRGLGDWFANPNRFPKGLKRFVDKVKAKGLKFGIWIEPEMVNPDSDLYRAHPEWCLVSKGRQASLSRNQLVLDMCNPDVLHYLKETFKKTFDGVGIDYIKWDCNRNLSEVGSPYVPKDRQDEVPFRYMLGVYELFNWFHETYPNIMIENCSGGGGRYDLGMMALSTQIWTSDDTWPDERVRIQFGSQLAYPAYVMSCHVSDPDIRRLGFDSEKTMDYKYKTALAGMLGYEMNIIKKDKAFKAKMKEQIEFYRYVENLIKYGELYRLISPYENELELSAYYYASFDKENKADRILLSFLQNYGDRASEKYLFNKGIANKKLLKIKVADENATYIEYFSKKEYSGKELKDGITLYTSVNIETGVLMLFEKI